ncbi:putative G-protein coupled receptor-like protein, partial [Leptotrombidium deliense]
VNASFSLNGVGLVHEETSDLYQENEELKEEIHKLATQIELMKLMQMEINNRHLKAKHCGSGHHAASSVTITANPVSAANPSQNPIVKAAYSRFETNDGPTPRISPAAELASERV